MSYFKNDRPAYVLLADGTVYEGFNFGISGTAFGEVVFTTGMTGYQEILTDPGFFGQIVMQTYPLIGNCGVNQDDMESRKSWVSGYIVKEWCEAPSNFRTAGTIQNFLEEQQIVGIWGIDTRALTRHLRDFGVMNGCITTEDVYQEKDALLEKIRGYRIEKAVETVSVKQKVWRYSRENRANHVALIDFGYKKNMMRYLLNGGCNVTVMPAHTTLTDIRRLNPDGILLSNGPGDPYEDAEILANVRDYTTYGKPIFAVGLGHQILAIAMGATVSKMHHGHRGANQAVKDLKKGTVFVTAQNHGYVVENDSLPESAGQISYINMNDGSCEGIDYPKIHAFGIQFAPESSCGPEDTEDLYVKFEELMERGQQGCL